MKLEDQLRGAIRLKQYSRRTEESYVAWYRRFVRWHGLRHPKEMGAEEVTAFLTHLAVNRGVGAVSQNQALNALVFLYREVLKIELEGINAKRAKRSRRLPIVLTTGEMGELLKAVKGEVGLVCKLLYGCGLRVAEALALRIKDVDLEGGKVEVRGGKGGKDRVVPLPKSLREALVEHRARVEQLHRADREAGLAGVALPQAMETKQPRAGKLWVWFWMFPAMGISEDPRPSTHSTSPRQAGSGPCGTGVRRPIGGLKVCRRHHLHEIGVSRELARAAVLAKLNKRVTAHCPIRLRSGPMAAAYYERL